MSITEEITTDLPLSELQSREETVIDENAPTPTSTATKKMNSKPNAEPQSSSMDVEKNNSLARDAQNSAKGFCMGVCDAVPGVSGGTVALIVGIYERLFQAISHIDKKFFSYLKKGEFGNAAKHMDARFLLTLVLGMGIGYVTMSVAIKILMASDSLRALTLASFCGMILGSVYLVFKMIQPKGDEEEIKCIGFGLAGCATSAFIAFQSSASATGEVSLPYLFCCTVVAICAMILPGISGAMLLLIFGVYYYVVEIPRNLIHFENVSENLVRMGVVLAGCLVGLLTFARVIKWLLKKFRAPTLSTMLGLMLGSLVILWPFQNRIEPAIEHHKPTYECFVPKEFDGIMIGVFACIVLFAAIVVTADHLANKKSKVA